MARVTVEDCIIKVPNRFELVLLATHRARDLTGGAEATVERENDKDQVIALREIAEGQVDTEELRQSLISSLQKHVEIKEPEDDSMEILAAAGKEWAGDEDEAESAKEPKAESAKEPAAAKSAKAESVKEPAAAKSAKAESVKEPAAVKSAKAESVKEPAAAKSAEAESAKEPKAESAKEPAAAVSVEAGAADADEQEGKDIEKVGSDAPAETSGDESQEKSETD